MNVRFRVVIDGDVDMDFLPTVLDGVRKVTPTTGGFTIQVGTAVDAEIQRSE